MAAIRTEYQAYIEKLLTAAGQSDAAAKAKRIYDLELKIARAHATREQSEDFTHSADVWAKADFARKAPGIAWDAWFAAAGMGQAGKFGAHHANAIPNTSGRVAREVSDGWKEG